MGNDMNIEEMDLIAERVFKSKLKPHFIQSKEDAFYVIQRGRELGLSPICSCDSLICIHGKIALNRDVELSIVYKSGLLEEFEETFEGLDAYENANAEDKDKLKLKVKAICTVKRKGIPKPIVGSFSYAEAVKAGIASGNVWTKFTKRMLKMRARGFCLRDAFADYLMGLYLKEELMTEEDIVIMNNVQGVDNERSSVKWNQTQEQKRISNNVTLGSYINENSTQDTNGTAKE